jgi:hypothetical protein
MELDDLKKSWQQSNATMKVPQKDIRELLQSRSEQPLAKLKRRFRKGMLLMPVIAAIMLSEFSGKKDLASHFLVWYLLCFCAVMMVYFYVNYRLVDKRQVAGGDVRSNLIHQTKMLTTFLNLRLLVMRGAIAFFFLLVEAFMYFRHGEGFQSWHARSILLRLAVYAGTFLFFFLFTRLVINHRYGRDITHLQELCKELEKE